MIGHSLDVADWSLIPKFLSSAPWLGLQAYSSTSSMPLSTSFEMQSSSRYKVTAQHSSLYPNARHNTNIDSVNRKLRILRAYESPIRQQGRLFPATLRHPGGHGYQNFSFPGKDRRALIPSLFHMPSESVRALRRLIRSKVNLAGLDAEGIEVAESAIKDIEAFTAGMESAYSANVLISDEGLITLYWNSVNRGVAIVFAGDGTADYSIQKPYKHYSHNVKTILVTGGVPVDIIKGIETVSA